MAGPPACAKAEGGGLQLARPWRGAAVARAVMCQSLCPRSGPGTAPAPSPPAPAPPFGSPRRHFVDAQGQRPPGWIFHTRGTQMGLLLPLSIPQCPCQPHAAVGTVKGTVAEDMEGPGRACSGLGSWQSCGDRHHGAIRDRGKLETSEQLPPFWVGPQPCAARAQSRGF